MARFRYSLQSILDIKLKMETQAKQEFSMAIARLDGEQKTLEKLKSDKKELEDESQRLLQGILNFDDIEDNKQSISIMNERILLQTDRVRQAEKNVETARLNLTEVMMDRKTHESLKEKAFEQFLQDENRAESKSVDELTSYTYGQKKGK